MTKQLMLMLLAVTSIVFAKKGKNVQNLKWKNLGRIDDCMKMLMLLR